MLQRTRITGLLALALMASAAPVHATRDAVVSMHALRALDNRLATIGDRLAIANARLCRQLQHQHGLAIHDLSQYPPAARPAATRAFPLDRGPAILALAEGGAAARAGLRLDDVVIAADGSPLPRPGRDVHDSFAPTERMIEALEAAFLDGVAVLEVRRGAAVRKVRVEAVPGCASRFQMVPSDKRAAKADGRYVQLTSASIAYTRSDDELAAFVAHELAHNILQHRVRLNEAGVVWDAPVRSAREAGLFQRTELEADRLAIHLMDRAGYDPAAAVRLWTRQSREPQGPRTGSHPSWASRIAVMEAEIAAIRQAKAEGRPAKVPLPEGPLDGGRRN
jgi:Zn-dependent protease with chaperone function